MASKGDFVLIHKILLPPEERASAVPEDTKRVPLEMWVKGHLLHDGELGGTVTVLTRTGREEKGVLLEVNPAYRHDFGSFVPELLQIDDQLRQLVFGGGENE